MQEQDVLDVDEEIGALRSSNSKYDLGAVASPPWTTSKGTVPRAKPFRLARKGSAGAVGSVFRLSTPARAAPGRPNHRGGAIEGLSRMEHYDRSKIRSDEDRF